MKRNVFREAVYAYVLLALREIGLMLDLGLISSASVIRGL